MWGHADSAVDAHEPYAEAPSGQRAVRYYDKSRMELTDPTADPSAPWFVTNGLLVRDLVTGQRQVGDGEFEQRAPASIPVAGDADDGAIPTYAALQSLLGAGPAPAGAPITERLSADGAKAEDAALSSYGVTAGTLVSEPGIEHRVASVFWQFMNSSGLVIEDGHAVTGPLFSNPFYATGLPLTEAYWVRARVGGLERDVLVQAFERRVLTYTPENPASWQVESGNVGQHYPAWLYTPGNPPPPTATPSETSTPAPEANPTATVAIEPSPPPNGSPELITVGPGAVDAWMRSVVRDTDNRVWVVAINNNLPRRGEGPGQLVIYRATTTGLPTAFVLVESGLVSSGASGGEIVFADAAIDAQDRLHVAWLDRGVGGEPVRYGIFDLTREQWTVPGETVDETGLSGFGGNPGQGGVSLALGFDGSVHVAYTVSSNHTQIRVRVRGAAGWGDGSEPLRVEGAFVWHPALAIGSDGVWYLAAYDATSSRILASVDTGKGWSQPQPVAGDALGPENIDQSPSILVNEQGVAMLVYLDAGSHVRLSAFIDGRWQDVPVGGDYFTHAPGLGLYAGGELAISGHDEFHPPTAMNAVFGGLNGWSDWAPLVELQADGSAVFRWAGAFSAPSDDYVDLVFFDEDLNDDGVLDDQLLYYLAVLRTD
jgi:hypothetical protein